MADDQTPKPGFRVSWEIGPAFMGIILQMIVGAFAAGAIYYRLDDNVAKTTQLTARFDTAQEATRRAEDKSSEKLNSLSGLLTQLKSGYDYLTDRVNRIENKIDANGNAIKPNGG